jgi:hypothetical protein
MKPDVLFYLTGTQQTQQLFEESVMTVVPQDRRVICHTLEELSNALQQSAVREQICVILVQNVGELLSLFLIKKMLRFSRLILVLPDSSEMSVALGHKFYPRFSDSIHNGLSNTAAVLAKMDRLMKES